MVTPALQRGEDVGERLAARVVGVEARAPDGDQRQHRVEDPVDVARGRGADRVAEADLVAAEVEQPGGDGRGRRGGRPRPRTGSRTRPTRSRGRACPGCGVRHDARRVGQRLVRGPVDVRPVERVGRADDDRDLVGARGDGALEAARRRHEDRVADARRAGDRREHLVRVGELRYGARVDERGRLDHAQARRAEQVDEADLDLGRDLGGLVLEPVARADLDDRDATRAGSLSAVLRSLAAARRRRGRPAARRAHLVADRDEQPATRPAPSAAITCSIFIASRTPSGGCSPDVVARVTWMRTIRPGIGAAARPASSAPAPPGASDGGGASAKRCRRPEPGHRLDRRPATALATTPCRRRSRASARRRRRRPPPRPRSRGRRRRPSPRRPPAPGRRGSPHAPAREPARPLPDPPGAPRDGGPPRVAGASGRCRRRAQRARGGHGGDRLAGTSASRSTSPCSSRNPVCSSPARKAGSSRTAASRSTLDATPSIRVASSASTRLAIAAARSGPWAITLASSES